MSINEFGLWEREVTTDLPEHFDASLYYIGRIHTPWKTAQGLPEKRP